MVKVWFFIFEIKQKNSFNLLELGFSKKNQALINIVLFLTTYYLFSFKVLRIDYFYSFKVSTRSNLPQDITLNKLNKQFTFCYHRLQ